jgi:hypothetical protein
MDRRDFMKAGRLAADNIFLRWCARRGSPAMRWLRHRTIRDSSPPCKTSWCVSRSNVCGSPSKSSSASCRLRWTRPMRLPSLRSIEIRRECFYRPGRGCSMPATALESLLFPLAKQRLETSSSPATGWESGNGKVSPQITRAAPSVQRTSVDFRLSTQPSTTTWPLRATLPCRLRRKRPPTFTR